LYIGLDCLSLFVVLLENDAVLGVVAVDSVRRLGKGEKTGEKCNDGDDASFVKDEVR
jgi:hypothetical protein